MVIENPVITPADEQKKASINFKGSKVKQSRLFKYKCVGCGHEKTYDLNTVPRRVWHKCSNPESEMILIEFRHVYIYTWPTAIKE